MKKKAKRVETIGADSPSDYMVTTPTVPPQVKPRPQIIIRKAIECARCHALNSFGQQCGPRLIGGIKQSYATCRECGYRAQIRYV